MTVLTGQFLTLMMFIQSSQVNDLMIFLAAQSLIFIILSFLMSGLCHLDRASNVEIGIGYQIFVIIIFFNSSRVLQFGVGRDATGNPEDPVPQGPGHFFTPRFPEE